MSDYADRWFGEVEKYNAKSSVPLSWMLIGGGEVMAPRTPGSPNGMATLSKGEWNRIINSKETRNE